MWIVMCSYDREIPDYLYLICMLWYYKKHEWNIWETKDYRGKTASRTAIIHLQRDLRKEMPTFS